MERPVRTAGGNHANALIVALLVVLAVLIAAQAALTNWRRDHFTLEQTARVRSNVDGQHYLVHPGHDNPAAAADAMAGLHGQMIEFLRRMRRRYGVDANGQTSPPELAARYPGRCKAARRLLDLYNPDNLAENSPRDPEGDTSYVLDKGAVFAMCLRSKTREGLLPKDMLFFVALHEMTHIAIEDVDHPPAFWRAFRAMLQEAAAEGLMRPVDYSKVPVDYCGLKVDYNPYFDDNLAAMQ